MPVEIPVLDDRSFAQLVAEGRSLIPRYSPEWTNHNAADPGIALLELLAWVTEAAIFQSDQLPAETIERFLDLLGVPSGDEPLDAAVSRAVRTLRTNERAITAADNEALARRIGGQRVARVEYVVVEEPVFRHRVGWRVTWARSRRGRIVTLGGIDASEQPWAAPESHIIQAIEHAADPSDERDHYYVEQPSGDRVRVIVAWRGETDGVRNKYLKTEADGDLPNNLLSLPSGPDPSFVPEVLDARAKAPHVRLGHAEPLHAGEPASVGMLVVVPPEGEPDRALLDSILVEVRRLRGLTARVHVVPPTWVRVHITVDVARRAGTGLAAESVRRLLLKFLDRLEGGEHGTGWPFGRHVYASELYQVLEEAPAVDHVVDLQLEGVEPDGRGTPTSVRLEPTELVRVDRADIDVTVSET